MLRLSSSEIKTEIIAYRYFAWFCNTTLGIRDWYINLAKLVGRVCANSFPHISFRPLLELGLNPPVQVIICEGSWISNTISKQNGHFS